MMKKIRLGIIFGGISKEHEVSLSSASGVIENLDKKKYEIIPIAITKKGSCLVGNKAWKYLEKNRGNFGKENAISLNKSEMFSASKDNWGRLFELVKNKKVDLFFPILHGPFGEDGKIQGFLDTLGDRYVFSGCLAQALAMNKEKAKTVAKSFGVPVLESIKISKADVSKLDELIKKIGLPMVVKPNELGSSVGISLAKDKNGLVSAVKEAFKNGDEILLEKYAKGREFTAAILQERENIKVLPVIEIIPLVSEIYDYKAKYEAGGSRHICPAEITKALEEKIKDYAFKVFKAVGCRDLARADFVFDKHKRQIYFIDLNTIPGMTPTSLVPEAARKSGINFGKLLDILIDNSISR